jgi:glycosyltransferase involved in cell wall biosynthesis
MHRSKPKILFLSHSATRNGATILLLDFLRWLAASDEFQIEVLMNGRGDLVEDFKKIAAVKTWRNPEVFARAFPAARRQQFNSWLRTQSLRSSIGMSRYDLIYANTAATAHQIPFLATKTRSLLWHFHEAAFGLRLILGADGPSPLLPMVNHIVAASESVKTSLVDEFQVPSAKVDVVHSFINVHDLSEADHLARRSKIRRQLGWPEDAFVVGACGSLGWRKGTDIFLQIARRIGEAQDCADIRFLWVGGKAFDEQVLEFDHDLRAFGLKDRCAWVPSNAEVVDYYCAMDVFAMTSREDPFPLVMLEAATLGLPVICFAKSGGPVEFVGDDAGLVAPYLDITAFAAHIKTLRDNRDLGRQLAAAASRKVRNNYTTATQSPKLLASIQRCLAAAKN